jgi:hypothetical protein
VAQVSATRQFVTHVKWEILVYSAADQWLTTLAEQEQRSADLIARIEAMIRSALP